MTLAAVTFTIAINAGGDQLLSDADGSGAEFVGAPSNFRVVDATVNSLSLSWDQTDLNITGFTIRKDEDPEIVLNKTLRTYTFSSLQSLRTYYFKLIAIRDTNRSLHVATSGMTE